MSDERAEESPDALERVATIVARIRPSLHRYCARLVSSVVDGEDIVQDTVVLALENFHKFHTDVAMEAWLFQVAHNKAIDHIRRMTVRKSDPLEFATELSSSDLDPSETLLREEAIGIAISRFATLPVAQRSAVVLKDVLGHSLEEISTLLSLSTDAVKASLSRGRQRLRDAEAKMRGRRSNSKRQVSPDASRFAKLFNDRNWDGLRALLADDVRLVQTSLSERRGKSDVGNFFSIYAKIPVVHLSPGFLDAGFGEEVLAVYSGSQHDIPSYIMLVTWKDKRITCIRDFRYANYILEGAELIVPKSSL